MQDETQAVDAITESILASRKYRFVSRDLIEEIAKRELPKRRDLQEATKATRNKLHQVAGAFIPENPRYEQWLLELATSRGAGEDAFRETCRLSMMHHSSTRERVPILRDFYSTILAGIEPIRSILDVACGLNPLSIPWMPVTPEIEYYAVDIYGDLMRFLTSFFQIAGIHGVAKEQDVIGNVPSQEVDVAFVLKAIPCLEQIDAGVGRRLLESLHAKVIVVSFPAQSLGGRNRGMIENYSLHFGDLVKDFDWKIERFLFLTELVFRIMK
jgi:16S rRNA (guanine(1405)-N(7))-methyltransferase